MWNFKDMVRRDRALFLNPCEFGERHRIEGRSVVVVLDDSTLRDRQGGAELGVAESTLLVYARAEDLPERKPAGSLLNLDGRVYLVDDWSEDMGLATVALRQNTMS